jgi:hypothetical protein
MMPMHLRGRICDCMGVECAQTYMRACAIARSHASAIAWTCACFHALMHARARLCGPSCMFHAHTRTTRSYASASAWGCVPVCAHLIPHTSYLIPHTSYLIPHISYPRVQYLSATANMRACTLTCAKMRRYHGGNTGPSICLLCVWLSVCVSVCVHGSVKYGMCGSVRLQRSW